MGDLSLLQIGGGILMVLGGGFLLVLQSTAFLKSRKASRPVTNSVPTMDSFMESADAQKISYETALARIVKLESELSAIRKVVAQSPEADPEVAK